MNTISNQSPMSRSVKNNMPSRCQGHYEVLPNGKMNIYFGMLSLKYQLNFHTRKVVQLPFSAVPKFATHGVPQWAHRLLKTGKVVQFVRSVKPLTITEELPPSVRQEIPVIPDVVDVKSDLVGSTEESTITEADTSQTKDRTMIAMEEEKPEQIKIDWKKPGPNFVVLVRLRSRVVVCAMTHDLDKAWINPNGSVGTGYSDKTLKDKGWREGRLGDPMFKAVRILLGYEVAEALAA